MENQANFIMSAGDCRLELGVDLLESSLRALQTQKLSIEIITIQEAKNQRKNDNND